MKIEKVALIGLGLIASSIAHALKRLPNAPQIIGTARSEMTRNEAARLGFCDEVVSTSRECVDGADVVIVCTPVGAMKDVAIEISPFLKSGAIVTDVGSVKSAIEKEVGPELPANVHFIPGHPIAGTENSGPSSGFAELFEDRWWILTPPDDCSKEALHELTQLIKNMGAKVSHMSAAHHDLVLSVTSHVPHLIAYTMVGVADDLSRVTESEVIEYSAAGFRDFTRIAASDPTMWRDVFLNNPDATLDILARFSADLERLKTAIRKGDGEFLFDYFTHTRQIRREILEVGQDVSLPNFGRNMIKK